MGLVEQDSDGVVRVINSWDPGTAFSERRCCDSLAAYLRNAFPKAKVSVEYSVALGEPTSSLIFRTGPDSERRLWWD